MSLDAPQSKLERNSHHRPVIWLLELQGHPCAAHVQDKSLNDGRAQAMISPAKKRERLALRTVISQLSPQAAHSCIIIIRVHGGDPIRCVGNVARRWLWTAPGRHRGKLGVQQDVITWSPWNGEDCTDCLGRIPLDDTWSA